MMIPFRLLIMAGCLLSFQFTSGYTPEPASSVEYRQYPLPDLRVEELSLVSVTRNEEKKILRIQVLIRVKNIGVGSAGSFQINGFIQQGSDWPESGCQESVSTNQLAPGASFVKVMIFTAPESVLRYPRFFFAVKADATGMVKESDESNNRSIQLPLKQPGH